MIMMRGNFLLEFSDYLVEIRTQNGNPYLALSFRRLFGDCDLDREKEKRVNSQKSFVLMSWRSLFEVSDSLFIAVIIVSQIDRKICLVLTCWLTALDGAVFQVTRCMNVCRGKDFYHIQCLPVSKTILYSCSYHWPVTINTLRFSVFTSVRSWFSAFFFLVVFTSEKKKILTCMKNIHFSSSLERPMETSRRKTASRHRNNVHVYDKWPVWG